MLETTRLIRALLDWARTAVIFAPQPESNGLDVSAFSITPVAVIPPNALRTMLLHIITAILVLVVQQNNGKLDGTKII